ncbi:MAG TPA: ABC transporter permease [Gaiellaceae bacterium]|nr:ABC transporter permease [Gaiellaceae bacterium]
MASAEWPSTVPTVSIEPASRRLAVELRPLWEYRQLLYFLTWRDLKVRYKQTALGASWALLQPLLTTIVFTVFFGRVAHLSSGGVAYPIFAFAGTLPWTFFSNGMTAGAQSVVSSASMITKVYFPRIALPISAVLGAVVDFLCAAILLVPLLAWYGVEPTVRLLALPLFLLLAVGAALGVTFFLSGLNVRYRDVRYVIPFLSQLWLFATPVAYSAASLHRPWSVLFGLNPMVGVVDGFRWAILGLAPSPGLSTLVSAATATTALLGGAVYFRQVEQSMADVI